MRDPAQVVKDILVTAGIGIFAATPAQGWSIDISEFSIVNDTDVLVNHVGGRSPYPHLSINFPSVHVMVRGKKSGYVAARSKANDVVNALLGMFDYVDATSGDTYRSCTQIGDIASLGQDDNGRPLLTMNFSFIVLPVVEAGSHRVAIT